MITGLLIDCSVQSASPSTIVRCMKRYTLKVGETAKVRSGFITSYAIVYAGMVSNAVYSVAVAWTCGQNSMAYNLFLSERQRQFQAAKGQVAVHRVSPEEIEFSFQA